MEQEYLSLIQLSQKARLNLNYIYCLVYSGKIRASKIGGHWKIAAADAERFIEARKAKQGAGDGRG